MNDCDERRTKAAQVSTSLARDPSRDPLDPRPPSRPLRIRAGSPSTAALDVEEHTVAGRRRSTNSSALPAQTGGHGTHALVESPPSAREHARVRELVRSDDESSDTPHAHVANSLVKRGDDGAVPGDETEERLVVLREIATLRKIPSLHDVAQVEGVAVPVDDDAFARGHGRTLAEAKVLVQKARRRARVLGVLVAGEGLREVAKGTGLVRARRGRWRERQRRGSEAAEGDEAARGGGGGGRRWRGRDRSEGASGRRDGSG